MNTLFEIPLPLVVLTGETASGKSVFPIFATPNGLDPTKPPQCVVFDFEDSVGPYVGALNFARHDIRQMMADGIQRETRRAAPTDEQWKKVLLESGDVSASPGASMFRGAVLSLLSIEPGKYLACSIDTFKPLQDGATEWLLLHPEAFGRTANQYQKMKAAILIPDARKMLDSILLVECRSRFEMTVLTYHQKNEWEGQGDSARKTGNRISEAWELADRLATLYATLDRRPKAKGKSAPRKPSGIVTWPYGKSRLLKVVNGEPVPVLPPRLPVFTAEAIRGYMASPPNYDNLKPDERMPDDALTDDQKLLLKDRIAAAELQTSENQMSRLELARKAAHEGRIQTKGQSVSAPTVPGTTPTGPAPITPAQKSEMMGLLKELFATGAEATVWLQANGSPNPAVMSELDAMGVLSALYKAKAERQLAAVASVTPTEQNLDGRATQAQRDEIKRLTVAVYGEQAVNAQKSWLQSIGVGAVVGVTSPQAEARITQLDQLLSATQNQPGGDDAPFA